MVKKINDEEVSQPSSNFEPSYAAFAAILKFCEDSKYRIFGVKTSKAPLFNWGFSGGKEEKSDKGNFYNTRRREYVEETATDDTNESIIYFQIKRKNNLDKGAIMMRDFINYFLLSFQKIEPTTRPKLSPKESVIGIGWFTLSEFEQLMLKQNHRVAFIELCYFLEEYAKGRGDLTLLDDLTKCVYKLFERPSEVGNVLMYKYKDGTTEWSQKALPYLLKDPKLLDGFKIFPNPKDGK